MIGRRANLRRAQETEYLAMPRETVWRRLWGQVKSTAGSVVVSPGRVFERKPRFFLFFFIVYIID
jgi:hypothetical protein